MSGSAGYYKYRCKYFLTHNCPHWVWVNNASCAHCLVSVTSIIYAKRINKCQADGRDSVEAFMPSPFRLSREIYVPQFENGALQYIIFEIISNSETDSGWTIKEQPKQQSFPTATEPSAVQATIAFDGIDSLKKS
jgi:hypothetical protein